MKKLVLALSAISFLVLAPEVVAQTKKEVKKEQKQKKKSKQQQLDEKAAKK